MAPNEELPGTRQEWKRRVDRLGLASAKIHTAKLKSASAISEEQYLLFHVLWKTYDIVEFDWKRLDLDQWQAKAKKLLADYPCWTAYYSGIVSEPDSITTPTFVLARYFQILASKTSDEELAPSVVFTPISNHTRGKDKRKMNEVTDQMRTMYLGTPSKKPSNMSPETPIKSTTVVHDNSDSEKEEEEEEEGEEGSNGDDNESSYVPRTLESEETPYYMYQRIEKHSKPTSKVPHLKLVQMDISKTPIPVEKSGRLLK